MKPIVEKIQRPPGQSFRLRKYEGGAYCRTPFWHIHPEYEIVFVQKGNGKLTIGNFLSEYEDGVLLFLGPNIPHLPFGNNQFPDNLEIVLQFDEGFFRQLKGFPEFQEVIRLFERARSGLLFGKNMHKQIGEYIRRIPALPSSRQLPEILRLLVDLSESEDVTPMNVSGVELKKLREDYGRINKIYAYVADHYAGEVSAEKAAEILNLTKNSFSRFFKKVTGKRFLQFVNEYRINQAAQMITGGEQDLAKVMEASGFQDPSYFSRVFKTEKGDTPAAFRKKLLDRIL